MTPRFPLRWIEKSETVRIAGVRRTMPLVYILEHPPEPTAALITSRAIYEPSAINFKLPVSLGPYRPQSPDELSYATSYLTLTPGQRRYYLDWLFAEFCEWPRHIGYVFLYICGLERRALDEEKSIAAVFDQILHLRDYYDRHVARNSVVDRGFETSTTAFLWQLLVRFARSRLARWFQPWRRGSEGRASPPDRPSLMTPYEAVCLVCLVGAGVGLGIVIIELLFRRL